MQPESKSIEGTKKSLSWWIKVHIYVYISGYSLHQKSIEGNKLNGVNSHAFPSQQKCIKCNDGQSRQRFEGGGVGLNMIG